MPSPAKVLEVEAPQPAELRQIKPIPAESVVVAESRRLVHHVVLPHSTKLDDAMSPEFWQLAASGSRGKLNRFDLIEVTDERQSFLAILLVLEAGPQYARVHLLQHFDLPADVPLDDLPFGHDVVFLGPQKKWSARRGRDVLKSGFARKSDAANWLVEMTRG